MSSEIRRVLAIDGAGIIRVIEEPMPSPEAGQVLIEVTASMVSPGTELGGVDRRRNSPTDAPPRPFGYSNAGVVCELGEGVKDLEIGQRVACMGGGYAQRPTRVCRRTWPRPYLKMCLTRMRLPSIWLPLRSMRRGGSLPRLPSISALSGSGGNFATQWVRVAGCHVAGLDQLPMRLEAAEACGADLCTDPTTEGGESEVRVFTRDRGLDGAVMARRRSRRWSR